MATLRAVLLHVLIDAAAAGVPKATIVGSGSFIAAAASFAKSGLAAIAKFDVLTSTAVGICTLTSA
jgi:hypothetical protein